MKPLNLSKIQIHQLADFEISKFLLIKTTKGFVCHIYIDGDILLLVTQKNETRRFMTLDASYNALFSICHKQNSKFEVFIGS